MKETNTRPSLYDHFPILREAEEKITQPDIKEQGILEAVETLFDENFVEDDLSIAMKNVGDQLASRIGNISYMQTRDILLNFGVQVAPFLELLYRDIDKNMLADRVAHTLIHAQTRIQEKQVKKFMTNAERSRMHMEFSQRLSPSNLLTEPS